MATESPIVLAKDRMDYLGTCQGFVAPPRALPAHIASLVRAPLRSAKGAYTSTPFALTMSFRAERGISPFAERKGARGMHHGNHGSNPFLFPIDDQSGLEL